MVASAVVSRVGLAETVPERTCAMVERIFITLDYVANKS